jgi:hypothetical protein
MKKTIYFAVMSLALGSMSASAAVDCVTLSVSVKQAVAADREKTLEVVSKQVAENSSCACEVVKAAIEGSNADPALVGAIVDAAAAAAPEQAALSAQCAIAVAPDARGAVQAVMAKRGNSAAPAATSTPENPLDFPAGSDGAPVVGPRPGEATGGPDGVLHQSGSPNPLTAPGGGQGNNVGALTPPPLPVNPPPVTDTDS